MSGSLSYELPDDLANGGYAAVRPKDNRRVRFFRKSERDNFKSQTEGRPVYYSVDMIEIRHPGERDTSVRLVVEADKFQFKPQWDAYQAGLEQVADGMPLTLLFDGQPHVIDILKALHITTIEQLAGASEHAQGRIGMGAREYVATAQKFLDGMSGAAGVKKLQAQVDQKDEEIRTLKAQVTEMGDRLTMLMARMDKDNRK